jgi:hypothetical protein
MVPKCLQLPRQIDHVPEEHAIEIFSANRADQPFDERMRNGRVRNRLDLLDLEYAQVGEPAVESPGRDSALLRHPPLRTVRDSFPSHGSSLYKGTFRHPVQQLCVSAL